MSLSIAFILTVYNRKDITVKSLERLISVTDINKYDYDIFMTDDGCTDGTREAVSKISQKIHIIESRGNLYWSGGMRLAWEYANDYKKYDYFIWFNDDALLYENALDLLFEPINKYRDKVIVSGAFCDNNKNVTYGGRTKDWTWVCPSIGFPNIYYMNGNLVLIPYNVFQKLGFIEKAYTHDLGDFDYALRAIKSDIPVVLTSDFVGECERHDNDAYPSFNPNKALRQRFQILYGPKFNACAKLRFALKYKGVIKAIKQFVWLNYRTLTTLS